MSPCCDLPPHYHLAPMLYACVILPAEPGPTPEQGWLTIFTSSGAPQNQRRQMYFHRTLGCSESRDGDGIVTILLHQTHAPRLLPITKHARSHLLTVPKHQHCGQSLKISICVQHGSHLKRKIPTGERMRSGCCGFVFTIPHRHPRFTDLCRGLPHLTAY